MPSDGKMQIAFRLKPELKADLERLSESTAMESPRRHSNINAFAVGDRGHVWSNRKWKPAVVISKLERGKSESFMVKAEDGDIVLVADLAKWKAGG